MTDSQITQCPKCDTTFRITPAQLKVAKGAVRCGACLHVFRASDHFQATKKSEPEKKDDRTVDMFGNEAVPKEPVKKAPTQNPAPEKPQADETKTSRTIAEPDTGILDELSDSGLIEDEDDFLIDDDNGLIDDELIDDGAEKDKGLGELNEEFLSLDADDLSNPFHGDVLEQQESIKAESEDDEDWAQALLNDAEDEEVISAAQAKPPKPKPKPQPKPQSKGSADDDGIALGQPAGNQFSFIQQDPLDLALPEKKSKLPFFIWSLVSLLLLATLVGQAAYFNFDLWARYDQYRPYYQLACEQLDCTLPSTYDVSRIRTTASPQVSSHAKYKNALTVDILFMNDAQYEQAFPRLELSFSDNNDKVISHRLFTPDEYLAGEAAGLSLMPTQTPIHIALEIQDPGKDASNYQVRFLAPL